MSDGSQSPKGQINNPPKTSETLPETPQVIDKTGAVLCITNCFFISSWAHKVRSFNLLSLKSEVNGFIIMARSESCHT